MQALMRIIPARWVAAGPAKPVFCKVIPDHRDLYLTEEEKAENNIIMICCSRSKTPLLVLDL
jgi:hypothetical protein